MEGIFAPFFKKIKKSIDIFEKIEYNINNNKNQVEARCAKVTSEVAEKSRGRKGVSPKLEKCFRVFLAGSFENILRTVTIYSGELSCLECIFLYFFATVDAVVFLL